MNYEIMGKTIAKIRLQNHLTQEQLAEKTEVSTVFISQIETGIRKPSLETVYKLSVALNTTIDVLLGNRSEEVKCGEIINLIKDRTSDELSFITGVLREICSNMEDGKIKGNN